MLRHLDLCHVGAGTIPNDLRLVTRRGANRFSRYGWHLAVSMAYEYHRFVIANFEHAEGGVVRIVCSR